jgi:glycosyltransferase involved in cell wall biosynthesis
MFLSGFTIVRNGTAYDYPYMECIKTLMQLCDEVVVNVGVSDDDTLARIQEYQSGLTGKDKQKLIVFTSEWPLNDPEKRKGGRILADQTNLALKRCRGEWCLYLQADEIIHQDDFALIREDIAKVDMAYAVDALVFQYVHFYGSYNVVQTSRSSYRREIRAIRNQKGIWSVGDAQSFRYITGEKVTAALTRARVFHYGWVRPQEIMKAKTGFMDTLYHPDATAEQPATGDNYKYKKFVGLKPFRGTHPALIEHRVARAQHPHEEFSLKSAQWVFEWKDIAKVLLGWFEALTGIRPFEYKNYRLLGDAEIKNLSKTNARVLKRV